MPIVIEELIIALAALLRPLVGYALRFLVAATLGTFMAVTHRSGGGWRVILRPLQIIAQPFTTSIRKVLHYVEQAIAKDVLDNAPPAAAFLTHLAGVLEAGAFSAWYTAHRTYDALYALRHAVIPRLISRAVAGALDAGVTAKKGVVSGTKAATHTATQAWKLARLAEATAVQALTTAEHAIARPVTGTVPRVVPWAGQGIGEAEALGQRALRATRDLRNVLAAGLIGGLIVKALTRTGTGNVYCRNLKDVERRVCGAPPDVLDALLGALALVIGTVSLVEFARACQTVEDEVVSGVRYFVRLPERVAG